MTANPELLDQRFVMMMSRTDVDRIEAYAHAQRIFGRSEAARRIIAAGLEALALVDAPLDDPAPTVSASPSASERIVAPKFPDPADCGRPVLGEVILPWLRANPATSYELRQVVDGVFGETATAPGRDQAVTKLFKAIGWKAHSTRRGGETRRTFSAPVYASSL